MKRPVRLVKSVVIGVAAGVLASVLVIVAQFALSVGALRVSDHDAGGGIDVAYVNLTPAMWIGLLTAVAAFVWRWRQYRRTSFSR